MDNLSIHKTTKSDYSIRTKTFDGKQHLVVPVVMMVEGVHSGSRGAVYHSIYELGKMPASWNGIPVVIHHPQKDGNFISANSPEVPYVGRIFNTVVDGNKLKAEAWIEESKINAQSPTALAYIRQGKPLEVSVGVFTDEEQTEGEWNGEAYIAIAKNHRPDHLALLPGETGACSWEDGCGIRVNSKSQTKITKNVEMIRDKTDENFLKNFVDELLTRNNSFQVNGELSHRDILEKIQTQLNGKDDIVGEKKIWNYVEQVYSNYFIYENYSSDGEQYYKQSYSVTAENEVVFNDEPIKVKKEINYIVTNKQEVKKMDTKSPCCLAKIEQLIANASTRFTEADKDWLLKQEEAIIDKLMPVASMQINEEQVLTTFKNTLQKPEDYIALMPKDMQEQFKTALSLHQAKRKELVQSIIANAEEGTWTEDELNAMNDSLLDKIAKTRSVTTDYSANLSANRASVSSTSDGVEILLPFAVKTQK